MAVACWKRIVAGFVSDVLVWIVKMARWALEVPSESALIPKLLSLRRGKHGIYDFRVRRAGINLVSGLQQLRYLSQGVAHQERLFSLEPAVGRLCTSLWRCSETTVDLDPG